MRKINNIVILLLALLLGISMAQEKIVENLLIDKTKTKVGHDFYELFSIFWEESAEIKGSNIIIEEVTDPQFGSKISIVIQDFIVYQSLITPRFDDLEEKAKEAAEITKDFLLNWHKYQKYLEEEQKIK